MMRSHEVAEAVGQEGESLERKRERLRQIVATPSERDLAARELLEVETQIADQDRAALQAEAKERLVGIQRALGSLAGAKQSKLDDDGLLDAAQKFAEQVSAKLKHFEQCLAYRHEAQAIAEVFGLQMPALPALVLPARSPDVEKALALANGAAQRVAMG